MGMRGNSFGRAKIKKKMEKEKDTDHLRLSKMISQK